MRAISLRMASSRPWLSNCPVADWNRRLNSSIFASASLPSSSSSVEFRSSEAASALAITPHPFREAPGGASEACARPSRRLTHFTLHELALHRELVHGAAQGFPGDRLGHPGELEHDPAGLDVRHPPLRRALAGTHPGLGRLLGQWPVGIDGDPDLPATADVPRHRDTGGLDLPVGHVRALQRLDAVLAEGHPGAALGVTVPVRPVLLAVCCPTRDEHASALLAGARGRCCRGGHGGPRRLVRGWRPTLGWSTLGGRVARTATGPGGLLRRAVPADRKSGRQG